MGSCEGTKRLTIYQEVMITLSLRTFELVATMYFLTILGVDELIVQPGAGGD